MSGVDVLNRSKAIRPEMAVLIVSGYPEDQYAINLLKAGASGFVAKDAPSENLVSAVRRRGAGPPLREPAHRRQARAGPCRPRRRPALAHRSSRSANSRSSASWPRGQSVSEIAKELFLSRKDREHLPLAHPREDELQVERGHHLLRGEEPAHRMTCPAVTAETHHPDACTASPCMAHRIAATASARIPGAPCATTK